MGKSKHTGFQDSARYFELIVYPESSDIDKLITYFKEHYISYIVSPLHDQDLLDDGTPKKVHYHVLVYFRGNRSRKRLAPCFGLNVSQFGNVYDNVKRMRYLTHLDDLDFKADYTDRDIYAISDDLKLKYRNALRVDYTTEKLTKEDLDAYFYDILIPWLFGQPCLTLRDCFEQVRSDNMDLHVVQYNLSVIRAIIDENNKKFNEDFKLGKRDRDIQARRAESDIASLQDDINAYNNGGLIYADGKKRGKTFIPEHKIKI